MNLKKLSFITISSLLITLAGVKCGYDRWIKDKPTFNHLGIAEISEIDPDTPLFDGLDFEYSAILLAKSAGLDGVVDYVDEEDYSKVIEKVSNPIEARFAIIGYMFRNGEAGKMGNKKILCYADVHDKKEEMDCSEATMIAAATLQDNGYRPLMLVMHPPHEEFKKNPDEYRGHAVFLYRRNGKFGFIGNKWVSNPQYDNLDDLVSFISKLHDKEYTKYQVIDLEQEGEDWMTSNKTLDKLIKYN
ncbi:hypothetical protein HOG16_00670 [Candidatus Woesearchaeota archaeon]|jgi:hypothetical protein|nr:hypothetical protein [Candidatus Woesearchaeota archaeon]MBT4321924.1 hypothetical protein [Candidatus Woesearchaeota archaeon]MBT4630619.1 hypothetical protein [Candidatus Woesearchaeota archaeon]